MSNSSTNGSGGGGGSSADTVASLERAAASADNASLLAAASRFQSQMRDASFDSDTITSRLWEAVVSSIANHQLPESSVAPLRELSMGLAAAKPPALVAVGGICSARLFNAGKDIVSLTGALRVVAVLGGIPAIQRQLVGSDLPLLLLRLHQQHSIAASSSLATDPSVSLKNSHSRSHPVPPLPSSGLRLSYSSSAASLSLMSPLSASSSQRSAAATLARSGSAAADGGGGSLRAHRDGGSLASSRDFSLNSATGFSSSRRSKEAPLPHLYIGLPRPHEGKDGHGADGNNASSRRPQVPPLSLPSVEDTGPLTRSSRRHALQSGRTGSVGSFPSSARASFTSRSVTRRDTMRDAVPINQAVSASVELVRVANVAGAAAVAAAAAFFAQSATPSAAIQNAPPSPFPRVVLSEASARSSPAAATSFRSDLSLPGFFSHRSSSSPAASAVQLNAAIIHAAAVILHDSLPLLQRHVPLLLSEMLVGYSEPPGSCTDIDEAAKLLLQCYGSLLSRHMFNSIGEVTLSQRTTADKFVLSLRGQLRLIDLDSGHSSVLRAAGLLGALSRHLAVNEPSITVAAYYACIDDIVAVRESLFMQSWSPASDSRVVLLSLVTMRLFTQFYENMPWQPARDALSKVLFCSYDSIHLLRQTCSLALLHEPTSVQLAEKHVSILSAISGGVMEGDTVASVIKNGPYADVASGVVLAAEVKKIALDHLAVLMASCAMIEKFDDELCREFMCFVADAPESMLMTALRAGPDADWHVGSLRILESALQLFITYSTARSVCASFGQSATPGQSPQNTPHGHYVTLLYSHLVVSRQQGLRSTICARACVLFADCLCQLLNLDGGLSSSVLDGLNAMHFIINSVGATAKSQSKEALTSKGVALRAQPEQASRSLGAAAITDVDAGKPIEEEEDWSSDDSLGDVDPARLKAAMLSVKMNLGDDSGAREPVRDSVTFPAAAPAAAVAAAAVSIPRFGALPEKGIQADTANKYLLEASGAVAHVATVAVTTAVSAASKGGSSLAEHASDDDDAWSSYGSDDSFGDVDPAKLKAAMLSVKMNLGDDNDSDLKPAAKDSAPKGAVFPSVRSSATSAAAANSSGREPAAAPSPRSAGQPSSVAVSPVSPTALDMHNVASDVHVALLRLALCLMVDLTQGVCIRAPFASQRPEDDGVLNVAFLLSKHLSSKRNKMVCLRLSHVLGGCGSHHLLRLLKLLSPFPTSLSAGGNMTRVGQGMFGTVRRRVFPKNFPVAVKELDAPQSSGDRQPLSVVFSEVTSLEVVSSANACTSLHDFGFDGTSWWIMMEWCPSSLKAWRRGLVGSVVELMPILLRTYKQVLLLVAAMHARLVVHLDLKADNVLIRRPSPTNESNVSLLLGDFGEAMVLGQGAAVAMKQSRGTECIQAPEMLLAGSQHAVSKHDRRKPIAASYSADVWSVGCLLYELLFGDFLFADPEWTQFFVRVTKDVLPIASDSAAAAMAPYPLVSAFLSYTLVRNPNMRPSISEVVSKFDSMFGNIVDKASPVIPPAPSPASDFASGACSWPVSAPSLSERSAFFRSFVPVHYPGNWKGNLLIGCWPPPSPAAAVNLYVVVTPQLSSSEGCACHHMCVSLASVQPFASTSQHHVAAFRSLLQPCFDAILACLHMGGNCAICSSAGTGCSDVVVVAASLMCSQGASLLQALRLLRQSVVVQTPPPAALDLIHEAFQSQSR